MRIGRRALALGTTAFAATAGTAAAQERPARREERAAERPPRQEGNQRRTREAAAGGIWVASWAASAHGPYPSGNPNAQPDQSFAFPEPSEGARDQSMRMMIRPDLWGRSMRVRFTNAFGTRPLVVADAFLGLQGMGGNLAAGTNAPITFGGQKRATIPAGATLWSDAVELGFVRERELALLRGRRLAVSFHLPGTTGPMTWHAKSLTTSYVSPPGSGARGAEESDANYPYTTASWFFVDMLDVRAPAGTKVICCFGDSITDGTNTTVNGDDRWPDTFSRILHTRFGDRVSVVNAGIGGNRVQSPAQYDPANPIPGGPSALARMERDVFQLSGLSAVIWMQGINDFGHAESNATADQVIAGLREGVRRMRERGLTVIGGTLTSALGFNGGHGTPEVDAKRRVVNVWIRLPGSFDAVADFDLATRDPVAGGLLPPFIPNSTVGGPGDRLHPNRAGLMAMAGA
ncbi:MAG: lysophospholipase, partial [Acetobacteraceae bacterium]|nr:lysophospholipase [Acetobacteraceae bacterium]